MNLLSKFRAQTRNTVETAAAQLARGDEVDVAALNEADIAAVEARAAELRRVAELQPLAAQVDTLRDKLQAATDKLQADRVAWRTQAFRAARGQFRESTPEQPDPKPRREVKAALQEAEAALRELLRLVPEDVAAAFAAADHAHRVAEGEANRARRAEVGTPARRAKLKETLRHVEAAAVYSREPTNAHALRAELAEIPSDRQLASNARAAAKALKAAEKARAAALKGLVKWTP